jgi:uncharacterized protein (DUF1499 family)
MSEATNGRRGGWLGALAWLALIVAVLAVAATAAAGPGYQAKWWDLSVALGMMVRYAGYAALGAGIVSVLLTIVFLIRGPGRLLVPSVLALLVSGGLLAIMIPQAVKVRDVPVFSALLGVKPVPPIHDITTDTDDPPQFDYAVKLRESDWMTKNPPEYDPAQGELQTAFEGYADIQPAYFDAPPEAIFDRALKIVQDEGWLVIRADKEAGIIEAAETSQWFGFTDDVVVRIRATEEGRTRLDMRSKSRIGRSDVGMNAERIRRFMAKMQGE